jgi:hypothetical protein
MVERRLRFETSGAQPLEVAGACVDRIEQRGLADACFSADDERAALTGTHGGEHLFQCAAFSSAANQFHKISFALAPSLTPRALQSYLQTLRK